MLDSTSCSLTYDHITYITYEHIKFSTYGLWKNLVFKMLQVPVYKILFNLIKISGTIFSSSDLELAQMAKAQGQFESGSISKQQI